MITYFVLGLALLQMPPKPAIEQLPPWQSPNSPALRRSERQRHDDHIQQEIAARAKVAAKPKRCAKTLWLRPCTVKAVQGGR